MSRPLEYALVAVIAVTGAYGLAWYLKPPIIPPGVTVEAKPASEVKRETKVEIPVKKVKVYKPAIKAKLKLPQSTVDNPDEHVISSTQVKPSDRPHTVSTVIDSTTGESTTFTRTDPLPWIAINTKSELGAYVGYKRGEQAIRIEGRQELLQTKAVHWGFIASGDVTRGATDTFVGAGAWGRW